MIIIFKSKKLKKILPFLTARYTFVHSSTATTTRWLHCSSTVVLWRDLDRLGNLHVEECCIAFSLMLSKVSYPQRLRNCPFPSSNLYTGSRRNPGISSASWKVKLALNAPIATIVVCSSRLLKCLRSLYGKQCGPRSDCSVLGPCCLLLYLICQ